MCHIHKSVPFHVRIMVYKCEHSHKRKYSQELVVKTYIKIYNAKIMPKTSTII